MMLNNYDDRSPEENLRRADAPANPVPDCISPALLEEVDRLDVETWVWQDQDPAAGPQPYLGRPGQRPRNPGWLQYRLPGDTPHTRAAREARMVREMQGLLAVTRALVTEVDPNRLLGFIVTQAAELIEADGIAVLLLCDEGRQLEMRATSGQAWLHRKRGAHFPVEGTMAELALATQTVQISYDPANDDRIPANCYPLHFKDCRSLLCAPLVVQNTGLGVLMMWSRQEEIFTGRAMLLIDLFVDQAALALYNARLHEHNRQLAIEQERHRLARELHDSVTQSLYGIGLIAQTALRLLPSQVDARPRELIEYLQSLAQTALAEIREQVYCLRPAGLGEKGLVEALTKYCGLVAEKHALAVKFVPAPRSPLSACQCEHLYYIGHEALWNVVKHAGAASVRVELGEENAQLVLSIADDGPGFDPAALSLEQAVGLRNMQERARLLGGTFELNSRPGQGTRITVRVPLEQPAGQAEAANPVSPK